MGEPLDQSPERQRRGSPLDQKPGASATGEPHPSLTLRALTGCGPVGPDLEVCPHGPFYFPSVDAGFDSGANRAR